MNRLYKTMCAAVLTAMLLMLAFAVFDRGQAEKPELSISSLVDGSFFREFQLYFADTFPAGEWMQDDYAQLEEFYRFGVSSDETEPTE